MRQRLRPGFDSGAVRLLLDLSALGGLLLGQTIEQLLELLVREVLGAPLRHLVVSHTLAESHHRARRSSNVTRVHNASLNSSREHFAKEMQNRRVAREGEKR